MFRTHRTFTLDNGVKNNTIAVLNDGQNIAVIYHRTTVFEKRGNKITLRTGGWQTISTKFVINRALEESNLPWRVQGKRGDFEVSNGEKVFPFADTLVLQ